MKRIALSALCLITAARILSVNAVASSTTEEPVPISYVLLKEDVERSYAIASISASLDPNGSIAGCSGSVELRRNGCKVQAALSIERSDDGEEWETQKIKSFTATQMGTTAADFQYYMTRGHYYRVTLTADTYDENEVYRDTLSVSSRFYYYR
mgnify:CR=1 FL=1